MMQQKITRGVFFEVILLSNGNFAFYDDYTERYSKEFSPKEFPLETQTMIYQAFKTRSDELANALDLAVKKWGIK